MGLVREAVEFVVPGGQLLPRGRSPLGRLNRVGFFLRQHKAVVVEDGNDYSQPNIPAPSTFGSPLGVWCSTSGSGWNMS